MVNTDIAPTELTQKVGREIAEAMLGVGSDAKECLKVIEWLEDGLQSLEKRHGDTGARATLMIFLEGCRSLSEREISITPGMSNGVAMDFVREILGLPEPSIDSAFPLVRVPMFLPAAAIALQHNVI